MSDSGQQVSAGCPAAERNARLSLRDVRAGARPLSLLAAVIASTGLASYYLGVARWHPLIAELALLLPFGVVAMLLVVYERKRVHEVRREFAIVTERSEALRVAAEARQLTQHIIEQSPIGMALYRGDTSECVLANEALARIVGSELHLINAQRFRKVDSWKRADLLPVAERVLQSGRTERATAHLVSTFGRELDVDYLFSRVMFENAAHLLLMLDDITDRVRAETRLRDEAARAQRFLDTVQTIVVFLDSFGRVTLVNRKGCEVLGWSLVELVGRSWFEFCQPQSMLDQEGGTNFHRVISGVLKPFESFDHPVITRSGELRLIEWRTGPVIDSDGVPRGSISSGIDVTEKREAEALNRRNHARLITHLELQQTEHDSEQALLREALHAGIAHTDSSFGCILYRAPIDSTSEYVSVSCDVDGAAASEVVSFTPGPNDPWRRVIDAKKPWLCNAIGPMDEFFCLPPTSSRVLNRFMILPIMRGASAVGLIGVANKKRAYDDIDVVQLSLLMESVSKLLEQRRAEQALDIANQRLQQAVWRATELAQSAEAASRAKSTFLANMSHELRTPLNAVLGFAELMQHDDNLTDAQRESLRTIQRCGGALLELINEVLELSKIEAGHMTARLGSVNLRELGRELHRLFQPQARLKGIELGLSIGPEVPTTISADEGKLRQILANLLANAIKFTSHGSVALLFVRNESTLEMSVVDTGVGVEHDALESIFLAFTQGNAGRESQQGTGLGLALCRMLARLHGGDVRVRSELGVGSTFTVELPLKETLETEADSQPPESRLASRAVLASGQRHRILVTEDSPAMRDLIEQSLTPIGFELHWTEGGPAAISTYERVRPQFVLLDLGLPGANGSEVVRRIRALEGNRRATIIGISRSAIPEDCQRAIASGCDECVTMPLQVAEILGTIAKYQGVSFVDTSTAPVDAVDVSAAVQSRHFPVEWWESLDEATSLGDIACIRRLADEIHSRSPVLAVQLRLLANRFDLRGIDELIHKGSGQWLL